MAKRNYSLFVKEPGQAKYTRLSSTALPLNTARRHFQSALLGGSMNGHNMALRPAETVPSTDLDANFKIASARDKIFPPRIDRVTV